MKQHNFLVWVISIAAFFMACSSGNNENAIVESPDFQVKTFPFEIDLDTFTRFIIQKEYTVAYDPFFGPGTSFWGYSVEEGFQAIGIKEAIPQMDSLEIIFVCKDGYAPSMPLKSFFSRDAFILPQEEKDLVNWPEKVRKKVLPYYITFTDGKDKERLPFPYGAVKIKIDYAANQHELSFPESIQQDSLLAKGFKLFQHRCGKCHSVNKEGGKVGPELNYPQNIMEYRSRDYFFSFVKNPQSYRYNSTMGSMEIEEDQLNLIYQYLQAMRNHKIKD